jgi:predicted DNA-binding transcriptional regulator YafY
VTPRTVYRDIATLQARRVPIEGAAGFGYVLRGEYALPPLMFSAEEAEAIVIGLRLLPRTGDRQLAEAARSVLHKIASVMPDDMRRSLDTPIHVSRRGAPAVEAINVADVRAAIRDARKMRIAYVDGHGTTSERVIRPIAMEYYVEATLLCAWCELRDDYRHFRTDRIRGATVLDEGFMEEAGRLRAGWMELTRPV